MIQMKNIETDNGERADILALMPPEDPNDHYLNFVIEGIRTLVRLEPSIPAVKSQRKIEWGYRLYCQRIQSFERQRPGVLDPRIVTWAKDVVAVKCIRQWTSIGQKRQEVEQLKAIRAKLGIAEPVKRKSKKRRKLDIRSTTKQAKASREMWAALKADPERYSKICEQRAKKTREYWAELKTDPDRYAKTREHKSQAQRQSWAKRKAAKISPEQF
jgi:hypothetical protein